MTVDALRAVAPFAGAIAVSPLTIAFVVGLLLSRGARTRTRAFLVVWFGTLTVVAMALLVVVPGGAEVADEGALGGAGADVAIGGLLAVLAVVAVWRARRREHVRPLVAHLDRLSPRRTAVAAAVLALNPKNLALALGGVAAVPVPGPSTAGSLAVGAGFALIASLPLLLAVQMAGTPSLRAELVLDRAHAWATRHGDAVSAVVLAVLAVVLVLRGLNA